MDRSSSSPPCNQSYRSLPTVPNQSESHGQASRERNATTTSPSRWEQVIDFSHRPRRRGCRRRSYRWLAGSAMRGLRLTRVRRVPLAGEAEGVAAPQIKRRFNLPGSPNETGPQGIFLSCAKTLKPGTRDSSPFPLTLARLIPCRDATEAIEFRRWRGDRSWAVLRRPRRYGRRRPSYRWRAGCNAGRGGRFNGDGVTAHAA